MQHFYDGQIRRYITQLVRMFSSFSYKDSKGNLTQIPVTYGDLTRQVSSIMRDNSENKIPSAPRMAVYITGLAMDTNRLSDASYINKLNIRERAYDETGKEYLNKEGKNYTVERLMPTPYTLTVNVDVWSTNTDQKLQILEQILMLFNPSLEIQTTDNYVDWTSLSVVNLENLTFSSRSIPMGTESEIDIATMTFNTPIYISPPVKVKRLGVVTQVINSIFNETQGTVEEKITQYGTSKSGTDIVITTGHQRYGLLVLGNTAKLIRKGVVAADPWTTYIKTMPFDFNAGVTELRINRSDLDNELIGTVVVNPLDPYELSISWDSDTFPSDTVISGPNGDRNKIDYIINPYKTNPTNLKSSNPRILILDNINDSANVGDPDYDGPDGWKNNDGTDFVANANDIIEWDGSRWHVVFDADVDDSTIIYTTHLRKIITITHGLTI